MSTLQSAYDAVQAAALSYPTAYEEAPWGQRVAKVNKKVFLFAFFEEGRTRFSMKLPASGEAALAHDFAEPMGYGMGRHGWVAFSFGGGDEVPIEALTDWLDESFRAVAPKKLLKAIEAGTAAPPPLAPPTREGVVALIGEDPLRLERAREALSGGGLTLVTSDLEDAVDVAGDAEPELVIVDVCRSATEAIALLGDIDLVCVDAQLVVVGVRDARMERSLEAKLPPGSRLSREAPGDPAVHRMVSELLG